MTIKGFGSMDGETDLYRTGIFITDEEKDILETEIKTSGMFLPGGQPMGDPGRYVVLLQAKYNVPAGAALNAKTGEFVFVPVNVESPVNDQQDKQRPCADNVNLQQEAAWANVCEDVPANIKENLLNGGEGPDLTNGPLKSQIIRCPKCGSSNVHLGHATVWGTPVCCRECGHFEPTKRI